MKRRFIISITTLFAGVFFIGCAVFAGKSDYADYREVRLAKDEQQRLLAMQQYTDRHPDGRWYAEIQIERQEREAEIYDTYKNDREGLEFFVRAYPDGIYLPHARARLNALVSVETRQLREQKRTELLESKRFSKGLELRRTWPNRFLGFWIQNLLWIKNWGASVPQVAEVNPEFSIAFGKAPKPRCSLHECAKFYFVNYAIPVPGRTRIDRTLRIILRLKLQQGLLRGAELLMPGKGFSRWFELANQRLVVDEDPTDRQQAVDWSANELMKVMKQTQLQVRPVPRGQVSPITPLRADLVGIEVDASSQDPLMIVEGRELVEHASKPKSEQSASVEKTNKPVEEEAPDMVMAPLEVPPEGRYGTRSSQPQQAEAERKEGEEESRRNIRNNREEIYNTSKLFTFQYGSLRGHIVAADANEVAPAYDGVVIELMREE
ncbi:MAG: hypothetical protein JXA30_14590 [Deltaproteobacteria bacterium]|nr:hypothetical protein [Deltaproteobacteria bacterium]